MKKFIIGISFSLLSSFAWAECNGFQCRDVTIDTLYVTTHQTGKAIIGTSGDESQLSCDAGPNGYLTIDFDDANYEAIYAIMLSSHTTNYPVQVRTSESGDCKVLYIISRK